MSDERHLSPEEQEVMSRALRRSVKIVGTDTQHIRALMAAATPGPYQLAIVLGEKLVIVTHDCELGEWVADCQTEADAALIVALLNSAEELLLKADKYDAIMDKKVAVFCHPGEGD